MQSDIWFVLNQQRNRDLIATAEEERLARMISPSTGPFRAALLILANGLIASGQSLKNIVQRQDRKTYSAASPCQ